MRTFIKEKLRTTNTAQFVIVATVITLLLSTLHTTITSFVILGRHSPELFLANTVIGLIISLIVAPFMTQIIKEATISEQTNQELKLDGNVERTKHDIVQINEATGQMHRFLNELLELSRIGRIVNPPRDVPFSFIVQDALDAVHGRLKARNVRVNLSDGLPIVFVDQIRIMQVIQNLLDNAAKFLGEHPHPSIEI